MALRCRPVTEREKTMEINAAIKEDRVKRFSPARIVEHWVHVLTFCVLVSTGLSQRFYSLAFSQWIILHLGGIDSVRLIHRFAGIIFSLGVITHITVAAIGIIYRKWQPSMVITKKDFTDVVHNMKYYLGLENAPTRGGRYTYKQKFEYWGILTGVLLMMATGAVLWFPAVVTKFLPGEIIPAAKVLHTNEALVVFLIISIWHVYNAIFSPDVFPLDTSIFTGYISKERMLLEHPEERDGMDGSEGERLPASSSAES
jgi:formate dehydrogenase gamma subunit